jgi:xanthine dehydrogenase molybdenum-binding subunit
MDEAAAELGIDPVELRRRNLHAPGGSSALGFRFTTCGQRECLEAVERALAPRTPRPRGRGVGIAGVFGPGGGTRVHGNSDGCGAAVKMEDDGTVQVLVGGQEIGQGGSTIAAQVAAETLGVEYGAVRVEASDTRVIPWDLGTHGSRNTFVAGNAVAGAAAKLRARLMDVAAGLLEAPPADLVARGGRVSVRGAPARTVAMAEVARAAHYRRGGTSLVAEHFYDPPTDVPDALGRGNKSATYAFGFQGAEVEVDEETGQVTVLRVVAAHDVGRAINPLGVTGQVEGGVAQGIGYALVEDLFSPDGRQVMTNLEGYKIPCAADVPLDIETILIETDDPEGPFGAKGVAEPGTIPIAPAIANAVADAIGVRIRDLPITPEKVVAALRARRVRSE